MSEPRLRQFEKELGEKLPGEYRKFLLRHNGGCPEPRAFKIHWKNPELAETYPESYIGSFHALDGESSNLAESYRLGRKWFPRSMIPIGNDIGGNELLLAISGKERGGVFYWVQELAEESDAPGLDNVGFVSPSFQQLLDSLYEE